MEIPLIGRLFSKSLSDASEAIDAVFKPKRSLHKLSVTKPMQQKINLVAYSPKEFFQNTISGIFEEMSQTYGNMPLWVRYSMLPISVSWNLGALQANHSLHVYGEEQYAKEFLARFSELVGSVASNDSQNNVQLLNQGTKELMALTTTKGSSQKVPPNPLQGAENASKAKSDFLGASGLIAGLAGVVLALAFFSRKKHNAPNRHVTRQQALQVATDNIASLTSKHPTLEGEEFNGNSWHFDLSDYKVTVNDKGRVTEIRRVSKT